MRRRDREVKDRQEVLEILRRCDTVRIAMQGEEYPYVVPVSFGMEIIGERAILYFHCAKEGKKPELLQKNPRVCVEGDIFLGVQETAQGITTRYESIIGFGECRFLSDPEEILHGLSLITAHYGRENYPLDRCRGTEQLLVGKIELRELSGKRNLPENP